MDMAASKTFFFAMAILFAIGIIAVPASAEIQTGRFKDYSIEKTGDSEYTQTLGMTPYVWDGSQWVDRVVQNNGTHYNVYSDLGSFSFNKSTCTITQYRQGFNPIGYTAHDSDIAIKNWFWTIARKNGANPWQVIDASIFDCVISTSSNSTGKYLTMTRTDTSSGSYLKVILAAPKDQPMEDFATLYMNKTAWAGNKFAFTLWAKDVKVDSLTYRNNTQIPIPNGITIIDKSQLTVDSMNFIKNGNAFFFDWLKAKSQFKSLVLNKTGSNIDAQFGFNDNPTTLTTGQKITMDPTYGYTFATSQVYVRTGASIAATCAAAASTNTNDYQMQIPIAANNNFCIVGSFQWNVSTIPNSAIVSSVGIRWTVDGVTTMTNCNLSRIATDITALSAANLWTAINDDADYVKNTATCTTATAGKTLSLGTNATADMMTRITTTDLFAFGYTYNSLTRDAANHQSQWGATGANNFELQVVYSTKPNAVTTLAAFGTTATTTNLSWTAPGLNGGTLQRYVLNYTTPCGIPLTSLPNGTTATSYLVSGLTSNTCYSFRVSAATEGGYNTTNANIVNVTTLAFNQANFTVGNLSFDAENSDVIPIFFERTDVSSTVALLNVTYPDTWELACDFHYKFAMTNHTYTNLTATAVSSSESESSFQFNNVDREIINVYCWDQNGTGSGKYLITQTVFPFLTYIQKFDSGHYGTSGSFGTFDLVYFAIVIVSLVGLNRTNESVGAGFMVVITAAAAYFHFITIPTAAISGISLIVLMVILTTRKD